MLLPTYPKRSSCNHKCLLVFVVAENNFLKFFYYHTASPLSRACIYRLAASRKKSERERLVASAHLSISSSKAGGKLTLIINTLPIFFIYSFLFYQSPLRLFWFVGNSSHSGIDHQR